MTAPRLDRAATGCTLRPCVTPGCRAKCAPPRRYCYPCAADAREATERRTGICLSCGGPRDRKARRCRTCYAHERVGQMRPKRPRRFAAERWRAYWLAKYPTLGVA